MSLKSACGRSLPSFDFEDFDFLEELFVEEQHIRMLLLAFEEYFLFRNPSFSRMLCTESDIIQKSVSIILLYQLYF